MNLLIVGNYDRDDQWSMRRFERMLVEGLRGECEVDVIKPAMVFGRYFSKSWIGKWLGYLDKFVLFRFALSRAVKSRPGCVVHVIDQGNGIWAGWAPGCVVTCHDLLAIRAARGEFPGIRTAWSGRIFQRLIRRGLRRAGKLVSVSETTRNDVERLIGKSELIPNGLEDFWRPADADEAWALIEKARVPRETGYLLHVGNDAWYKNRGAVLAAFCALKTVGKPRLVIVGPQMDAGEDVTVLDSVTDEMLRALYSMARALVQPSIAEGFGWPIIEAQACGCPVVTADREPMRETAGGAAVFSRDRDFASALTEALEMNGARRAELVEAGKRNAARFCVKRMAQAYRALYQRLD